ncbi:DegT/DnrJ/EryC1/StrS family aminotransferase [Streptomyces sp. GC420]|uniref:DegT/DnrJ/EryC1/StrS family aminotransferase n=1 Tax=Streptomyces sp. GC420 TaxID=2697568 RepID=UPI001AA14CDD|nr:DegT/DnrJ/EryC1/StrS family aminotransferase [Streptomyces sp. GC420]NBM17412.1 DegT/DnrJ/EryC1/StrS aminotransferase [Streptomyces sp. GC420]
MGTAEMLRAAGVGAGDEVVVSAFGNAEVAEAVMRTGALPVFADIERDGYCLDAAAVDAVVSARTAAVIAVHRFGHPADMARLHEVGRIHGLLVLEEHEPQEEFPGELAGGLEQRRVNAAYLSARLRGVETPVAVQGHTYAQYVVRVPGNGRPDRDAFARAIRARGVECRVPVKVPVHRMPGFRRDVFLPETERAAQETLALPLHGSMSRRELQRLISACNTLGGLLQAAF